MINKIKKMAMLLMFVATVISFSACEKDNEDDSTGGGSNNYPASIASTQWEWKHEASEGIRSVAVSFSQTGNYFIMTITSNDIYDSGAVYNGTYTYSEGKGSVTMENSDTHEPATATFSINGSTMTFKFNGATYTLTKK